MSLRRCYVHFPERGAAPARPPGVMAGAMITDTHAFMGHAIKITRRDIAGGGRDDDDGDDSDDAYVDPFFFDEGAFCTKVFHPPLGFNI